MAHETIKAPLSNGAAYTAEHGIETALHNAGVKLGSVTSTITQGAANYSNHGKKLVKENPEKAVALAAAAGMVAGGLLAFALLKKKSP